MGDIEQDLGPFFESLIVPQQSKVAQSQQQYQQKQPLNTEATVGGPGGWNGANSDLDLDFIYDDCDNFLSELSEFYSYTECNEYELNRDCFYQILGEDKRWRDFGVNEKKNAVLVLLDCLEMSGEDKRLSAVRALAYLCQGNFSEIETENEFVQSCRSNCFLLYQMGIFVALFDTLKLTVDFLPRLGDRTTTNNNNGSGANGGYSASTVGPVPQMTARKSISQSAATLNDCTELRMILSVLYTMVEVLRTTDLEDTCEQVEMRHQFMKELGQPIIDGQLPAVVVFQLVLNVASDKTSPIPTKKTLLLLWKIVLCSLGGVEYVEELRRAKRLEYGLVPLKEDSIKVVRHMRASTPPLTASDMLDQGQNNNNNNNTVNNQMSNQSNTTPATPSSPVSNKKQRSNAISSASSNSSLSNKNTSPPKSLNKIQQLKAKVKFNTSGSSANRIPRDSLSLSDENEMSDDQYQSGSSSVSSNDSAIDSESSDMIGDDGENDDEEEGEDDTDEGEGTKGGNDDDDLEDTIINDDGDEHEDGDGRSDDRDRDSPDDEEVLISLPNLTPERLKEPRALPWQPKIRTKDIQDYLDHSRVKYVGYKLKSDPEPDLTTLAGLPQPIKDSVAILKQYLYVPLSEVQLKQEEVLLKNPISKGRQEKIEQTPTELLYKAIHPNLPQYMIALLKILLAATPTSPQGKSDTVNLLSDLLPAQTPSGVVEAMKLTIDMNRHKEIIVKSVSALLLLLLKHFKINHICQFEHCAQHMVFANCIPLVLKFFNQSIGNYVQAQNTIATLELPYFVLASAEDKKDEAAALGGDEDSINRHQSLLDKGKNYYCWRNLFSCINLLRILNKLVKWKNSRIMMLVVFKSGPILKRALKVRQAMLQLYVLKLIKIQTKFLGRQWRKSNMKTMSVIYQKVRHRMHDDWAFGNEPDSRPWDFQLEEGLLRSRVEKFNTRRYENVIQDPTFVPVDNNLHSLLNSPEANYLPAVFTENYEQWLEKEVFLRNINWDALLTPTAPLSATEYNTTTCNYNNNGSGSNYNAPYGSDRFMNTSRHFGSQSTSNIAI